MIELKDMVYYIIYSFTGISTLVFSFFLLKATRKGNEINENNLKLQSQIIEYQNELREKEVYIKLVKFKTELIFYYNDFKSASHEVRWNNSLEKEGLKGELINIVKVIETYKQIILPDVYIINDIKRYSIIYDSIKAHEKDILNCCDGKHDEDGELIKVKEFARKLMDQIKELYELIYAELMSK